MPACSILMASSVCTWLPSTRPARAPSSPARGTCTPRVRLKACGHSRSALWRGNARRCQQLRVWRVTPRRLASHQQQPLSPVTAHCPPAESPLRVPDHSRRPRRIACESCANGRDPAGTHHVLPANTTSASPSRTPPPADRCEAAAPAGHRTPAKIGTHPATGASSGGAGRTHAPRTQTLTGQTRRRMTRMTDREIGVGFWGTGAGAGGVAAREMSSRFCSQPYGLVLGARNT